MVRKMGKFHIHYFTSFQPSRKFVSRELSAKILSVCEPMVKWLREAEEEDSEDSEEETQSVSPQVSNFSLC